MREKDTEKVGEDKTMGGFWLEGGVWHNVKTPSRTKRERQFFNST